MNSKLLQAFKWIFAILLGLTLLSFFSFQNEMKFLILAVMLATVVISTISYLPDQSTLAVDLSHLTNFLSQLIIITVIFLLALWELSRDGVIDIWFFVLLLTVTLSRPVIYLLLKAFRK